MSATALHSLLTPRLCLRSWQAEDVDPLACVVERDLAHLRPWLPWAEQEPISREARLAWVRHVQLSFELGSELYFGVWSRPQGQLLGGHGLHRTANNGPYETGYWVASDQLRQGVAREATAAVTRYALLFKGIDELMIRIRPHNHASGRVAESLGFAGPEARTTPKGDRCGEAQPVLVYTMNAAQCRAAPWSHDPLTLVDIHGAARAL